MQYGDDEIMDSTNIVFTNGDLDPYIVGGIQKSLSRSVVSYTIKDAAHHQDLLNSNPSDSESLKETRNKIKERMREWLAYDSHSNLTSGQSGLKGKLLFVLATIFSKLKFF